MSQSPNWKKTLSLAVFLCTLSGFAYWLEFKHRPATEELQDRAKKIFALTAQDGKPTQVKSIRITSPSGQLELECADMATQLCKPGDNSKWQLTSPLHTRADDGNSNSLLSSMVALTVSDPINLKDETSEKRTALLKDYGLDQSSLASSRKLQVRTASGGLVLYLGSSHPIGEGIFGAVEHLSGDQPPTGEIDETEIYLIPNYFKVNFERPVSFWRDKKLLAVGAHEVESFSLKNTQGEIQGVRKNGGWILSSKQGEFTGDQEAMDTLLTGVTFLTAKDFVADQSAEAKARDALKGAKQIVRFSLVKGQSNKPITLTLYQKSGHKLTQGAIESRILATVSDTDPVFELENYVKERLDKSIQELRLSKLITSMDRFSARRIELSGAQYGDQSQVLLSKDSKWILDGAPATNVDAEKIQNFLDHLSSTKIIAFTPSQKNPPPVSALRLIIGDEVQSVRRKFLLWREVTNTGPKLFAQDLLSSRKEVFLMDNSLLGEIPWEKNHFVTAKK